MTTELADDSFVALTCCDAEPKHKRTQHGWEGDYEITRVFFECQACGTQFAAESRRNVGPPSGEPS